MKLHEKLSKLRREHGYTQEELAEELGVTRQAVGKWESGAAYPETDTLLRIGELYDCSMDYLLKDGENTGGKVGAPFWRSFHFERKSKRMIGGLPLWHINIGIGRTATGVFAVGLCAKGIVSVGLFSLGLVSVGVFSLGLLALGTLALGLLSLGAVALGVIAFGAVAVGLIAVGAAAVGQFAFGAAAVGQYLAIGDHAWAAVAIGKTKAVGTVFEASTLSAHRAEVFAHLDACVPTAFSWLKSLIKLFL